MASSSAASKRFLFQLSAEESSDPTALGGFAQRLPMPHKSGGEFLDGETRMQREHFQKIINMVWRNPKVVSQAAISIDSLVAKMNSLQGEGYFKNVSVLKALDEDWACMFLISKSNLTIGLMESALRFGPDVWKHLLCYALRASPTLRLPKVCKDKSALSRAFAQRLNDVGDRLDKIPNAQLISTETGGIDWLRAGVYRLTFDKDGRAVKILHSPSSTEVPLPEWVYIDKTLSLDSNWCDTTAALVKPPASRIVCCELFEKGSGPHIIPQVAGASEVFDAIVAKVAAAKQAEPRNRQDEVGNPSVRLREKQRLEDRREGMKKARIRLEEKKASLQRKWTVTFS